MNLGLRTSIRWKLTVFVACVVALTATALSVTMYFFARRTLHREIHARLSVVVSDRRRLLLAFIHQQQEKGALVASRTRLRQMLVEVESGQMPVERFREDSRRYLLDSLRSVQGIRAIWIADPNGKVIAGTDDAHLDQDVSAADEFREGRGNVQLYLRHDRQGHDEALVSVPATEWPDRLVGVVMMTVDAEPLMEMLADRTGLGATGGLLIGTRVADRVRFLLVGDTGTETEEVPAVSVPAMMAAIEGRAGFEETHDRRGVRILAAYQPTGYRDWGIEAKINVEEAYAPIAWLRRAAAAIGVVVLGIGLMLSHLLARRFTRPILRMAAMADSIADGGLHARVVVETGDELGQLAEAFNKMTEEVAHAQAVLEERVKQRTAELRGERDLLQSLMDHSPDRIYFKDLQSRFIRFNKALVSFHGATDPAALLGKTDFDLFSTEHAQQALDDEQAIIRTGQPMVGKEEKETWTDGHVTWSSSTKAPLLDHDGRVVGTFGISRDVTARRQAEEELNRYFSLSLDMFCIADFRGYFKRLNPAWEHVLGYRLDDLRAVPFLDFVHPEDRQTTTAEFQKILGGQRTMQFENRYRCKNGSYRWLQWSAISAADEQLIYAVARDVSEHKRAQELLARFADTLNQKNLEMQEDLKMAREVHQVFVRQGYPRFPRHAAAERSALRFSHRYLPTTALGGDFFEILQLSNMVAGVFICDVMGHGMRAALVTSILRGLIDRYRDRAGEPGAFLTEINRTLLTNLKTVSSTIFATAYYVVIDTTTGQVQHANAGHPSPLLLRPAARTVEPIAVENLAHAPALGLMPDAVYRVSTHELAVGDSLLLFTDGLYEVEDRRGQQFGIDKLRELVRRHVTLPGAPLLDELLVETRRYSASGDFADDVCLLSVELAEKIAG